MQVDVGIGPAGDVWATNNWRYYPAALGKVDEALSTLGSSQGVVVFFGMAKPVRTPMNGPPRLPSLIRSYICGGGGWGDPLRRPIEKVLQDVRGQLTSVALARAAYGVVIYPVTLKVDEPATRDLRHEFAGRRARAEWQVPVAHHPNWPRTSADMSIFRSL